ncbi:paraquat-inducible protein A [Terrimicrobium sacchariphilum]|uniref:Paraquat-inducible protein A n=1 Tax=Terrimicrobium sacchariphilum TaxID=690879 RepID=A0A146G242_TERSA|nr:paraquat-inducible protein A [Terrimicrobium sacchariphilum]GAT31731.1 paraquat-inducible protein A [Terrimicrobium sacchariphilum]
MTDETRLSMARSLVVAGLILYIPANILPVMTITITGQVEPLTIMGGVEELYDSGLMPVAAVVFLASIVVPFLKLAVLSWILLLHGSSELRRQRTTMYRILHQVGSWSMIDIFLLSVLTAVGQLGILASVKAEPGGLFFAAVLLCTLFAAEIYHPSLIWKDRRTT